MPWPGAGTKRCGSSTAPALGSRPRRCSPARASTIASKLALGRAGAGGCRRCRAVATTSRSSRAARSWAARRMLLGADPRAGAPARPARRLRTARPRGARARGRASSASPAASSPGTSLAECTARSIRRRSSASSSSTPSATCPAPAAPRSPPVSDGTISQPAQQLRATSPACASASALPRVPIRISARDGGAGRGPPPASPIGSCGRLRPSSPQREQLAHELQARVAAVLAEAAQADRRLVQQAAHHRSRDRLDAREVARGGRLPAPGVLGQHLLDDRRRRARAARRSSAARRAGRASARSGGSPPRRSRAPAGASLGARVEVARDDGLEVVDVVQAHALELAAARVDVARHRDVDQQQRAARRARASPARAPRGRRSGAARRSRRARCRPRSSCSGRPSRPTTEPPKRWARLSARSAWRLATKIVSAPWSASARAVSSLVSPAPMITTWRSCSVAEDAQRELDRHRRDAHAAGADRRLGAHALAGRQRGGEQAVDSGPVHPARIAAS